MAECCTNDGAFANKNKQSDKQKQGLERDAITCE